MTPPEDANAQAPSPSAPETINLSEVSKGQGVVFNLQTAPPEDPKDANVRRIKELVVFVLSVAVFLLVLGVTASFLFFSTDPEEKKVGLAILASIATGIVGFLFGKKSSH